jgi:Protein of unknown function (DUF2817)
MARGTALAPLAGLAAALLAGSTTPVARPMNADVVTHAAIYFPSDYDASRARFRADCAAAATLPGTRTLCSSHPIRYDDPPPGAPHQATSDIDLTIDTAYISRSQPRLLILRSGLHGAEGFAGAAVERLIFEKHLRPLLDAGYDVLMIHAANPWGFRHVHRVDGNNVDLNRNFPTPGARENAAYDALRGLTESQEPVRSVSGGSMILAVRTAFAFARHGFSFSYVSDGTHAGQWRDPHGFEYGGREPAQQVAFWREMVAPLMAAHPGPIVFLDLHTGLGPANTLTIYSGSGPEWTPARKEALAAFARGWEDARIRVAAPGESEFQTVGDVIDFVPSLARDSHITAVTLEWGTIGDTVPAYLATNARMILEHRARFHGCASPTTCEEVQRNFAELFNPKTDAFRASVLTQADAVLSRLATTPLWPSRP